MLLAADWLPVLLAADWLPVLLAAERLPVLLAAERLPVLLAVSPATVCSTELSNRAMIQSMAREIMVGMLISASTTRVALAILLSSS